MANKLRKDVLGAFTNIMFEVRRVSMREYLLEMKDLPFSIAPGTQEELDKLKETIESLTKEQYDDVNARATAFFLERGIVRMKYPGEEFSQPNIWFGEEVECPENMVTISDLGSDAELVAGAICEYSFDLKGVKALEGFFRNENAAPAGPSGEAIRTEAVEPAAAEYRPE